MECANCGRELIEGARFCSFCGRDQVAPIEPEAVLQPEIPPEIEPAPLPVEPAVVLPPPHPWLRYFARAFDMSLAAVLFIPVVSRWAGDDLWSSYLAALVVYSIVFAIEGFLIASFGATPGKALFQIRVESQAGGHPALPQAFRRSALVLLRGLAMGIPFLSVIAQILSYVQLTRDRITGWDRDCGTRVKHGEITVGRAAVILIAFFTLIAILTAVLLFSSGQPIGSSTDV